MKVPWGFFIFSQDRPKYFIALKTIAKWNCHFPPSCFPQLFLACLCQHPKAAAGFTPSGEIHVPDPCLSWSWVSISQPGDLGKLWGGSRSPLWSRPSAPKGAGDALGIDPHIPAPVPTEDGVTGLSISPRAAKALSAPTAAPVPRIYLGWGRKGEQGSRVNQK